jgi:dienelactone hydrolase
MWFATHGYACLLIDTLQLGEIAAIHHGTYRYDRWWWQARGYTPAGVECWNGIRALDYLQSRPEVDPERLAVTGISGGGAATFWIAAADERVKVAVPVSGMGDLEDYVGEKVVNGHCDCMFLINTFQWPWTRIAALVAPRPMLFENSGHDTIFPMNGNDRIRARLERLYGFYTNRTDRLFDIGVTPGGHDDKVELRLMAYRWINRFLKGDDKPVTEPDLPPFEGRQLRAFPDDLPADEINTKIDETFVPMPTGPLPSTAAEYQTWRSARLADLTRIVFPGLMAKISPFTRQRPQEGTKTAGRELANAVKAPVAGGMTTEPGIMARWRSYPGAGETVWLVVLGEQESLETKPDWLKNVAEGTVILMAPRNTGADRWSDSAPYYVRRSLPLLGRTVDGGRLLDTLMVAGELLDQFPPEKRHVKIAGRGQAGIIAAYAGLMEPRLSEVVAIEPPVTHREGPIFLNILRVVDVPEAFGLLAPRPLHIVSSQVTTFERTRRLYEAGGGRLKIEELR